MKIDSSVVAMQGSSTTVHAAKITTEVRQQTVQEAVAQLQNQSQSKTQTEDQEAGAQASISDEAKKMLENSKQLSAQRLYEAQNTSFSVSYKDFRVRLLESMLEALTGKRFKMHDLEEMMEQQRSRNQSQQQTAQFSIKSYQSLQTSSSQQIKLPDVMVRKIEYYEKETMSFNMNAQVKTSDGKTIDVQLALNMSREFYASNELSVTEVVRKDPLVINFNAPSAALSSTKFEFDIDCDGTKDQISQLMSGSGFLAVDWNNDGTINDGSELFGAKSGDGFADLAKHDGDGNGWIDENDAIFDKLRVWVRDDKGNDTLVALGELGIGAIYLGNVNTAYSLKDGAATNGYIQKTGFFLREDGTAGTVQHVDLVV